MKNGLGRKLVFISVVFLLLFNAPLLGLFDQVKASASPVSFLLFFLFWGLLVLLLFLLVRRSAPHDE